MSIWMFVCFDANHDLKKKQHVCVRSFTAYDPKKKGCQIGVVLYQSAFFISKANHDATVEITGRTPYNTGGFQLAWEGSVSEACSLLVFTLLN